MQDIRRLLLVLLFLLPSVMLCAQDLAVYEARGPVKQIIWARESGRGYPISYFNCKHDFDRRGRDKGVDKRYYAERDKRGRMKREGMDPTDAYYWHYDKKGRVTWVYYLRRGDYEFDEFVIYYFYAANGEVGKYRIHSGNPSDVWDAIDELTVRVTERDSHGNWTKRELTSNDGQHVYKEERAIAYYK